MDPELLIAFRDNELALKLFCASKLKTKRKRHFNLNRFTDSECLQLFRFDKRDIRKLVKLLHFPPRVICKNRTSCYGTEALCILLRRMAYPNRLFDLQLIFYRSCPNIGLIFNYALKHIMERFEHLITDLDQSWLSPGHLRTYSDSVTSKGAPLPKCWGFIDGTVRSMCRPTKYQQNVYNGHKRTHSLKYQSVVIPNGLVANLYGPIEGRRHDAYLLSESELLQKLSDLSRNAQETFYLYGDPAYPLRPELMTPFRGSRITVQQAKFNKLMSMSRVSVEWMFAKILSLWAFVDYKKNQKLFLQPLARYFKVAVLLTNIHTCIHGNQVSDFFGVDPPSIEEYLQLRP